MTHVIRPDLNKDYPVISHGKGIYLFDSLGNRYIDACSGAVTASIGHGIEEMAETMANQAKKVAFAYRSQFTSDPAEKLADKLSDWAPGDLQHVFFVNSGSEATETALKIAVQYWQENGQPQKTKVLSRWMSYHGITLGALSMSGHVLRRKKFDALLEDWPSVSPPYCYHCPFALSYPSCQLKCAAELETAIRRAGADRVAAFIAEPVIGASGGAVVPPAGYYQEIQKICHRYNILFIADEVMTGIGRTGAKFAMDHWGVVPDIITVGKGISGGYTPIAATIVSERIIAAIRSGSGMIMAGHTFSANPLSSAVSLAVMEYMEKHELTKQAAVMGNYLIKGLSKLQERFPVIGDVRGLGLLCAIELTSNPHIGAPFSLQENITGRLVAKAFAKGLIVYPASGGLDGEAGDAILIAPPLIVQEAEIELILYLLAETIGELQQELEQEGLFQQNHAI